MSFKQRLSVLLDIVHQFPDSKELNPQILYIWGHSYEFDSDNRWDRLEKICELLSGRTDVFYGTNAEVLLENESLK